MALLFRKKHVINSIRAAYLLKHHDNGLVVDDSADSLGSYEAADVDLTNLSMHMQTDTSTENLTGFLSRSPMSPLTPVSVSSGGAPQPDASTLHGSADAAAPAAAPSTDAADASAPNTGAGAPPLEMKDFALNSDDESDFEEDLRRVAHEIKYSEPVQRRATADSDARRSASSHTSPARAARGEAAPMFVKRAAPGAAPAAAGSRLTSQLTESARDPREQYLEAVAGLGSDGKAGVRLAMHLGAQRRVDIVVKQGCTGHLALGFALLKAQIEPGDANLYNLRLAEDDGEPDEDFPALDRSRPVAAYHVDELAVVRATEAESRENSKRTPNKVSFRARAATGAAPPAAKEPTPVPAQAPAATTTAMGSATATVPPLAPQLAADPRLYALKAGESFAGSLSGARADSVALRMFMDPYDPLLSDVFWEDAMVSRQSRLKLVFEQMCREKMMDTEMFVLRTVDEQHRIVDLSANVASLFASMPAPASQDSAAVLCLEVVPRRNLPRAANSRQASLPAVATGPTPVSTELGKEPAARDRKRSSDMPPGPVLPMQPLGFYKYPVLRRQQMNFLSRSERELVIDGEYIHIMPPTDWSLLDQPKTTTFHIRQVIRVKQRKVPTNFCVTVMKATGPKRYDMESKDASTTAEIVNRIISLKNARVGAR